jgi:hypothetical protein
MRHIKVISMNRRLFWMHLEVHEVDQGAVHAHHDSNVPNVQGQALTLLNLLTANDVKVGIITETEIPSSCHGDVNVEGCHSFLPLFHSELLKTAMYRVVVMVRSALAALAKIWIDLMHPTVQTI